MAEPEPEALHAEEAVQLGVPLQNRDPYCPVQNGYDSAQGNQQPDDGNHPISHQGQQAVGRNRNGNCQIPPGMDGSHKQKRSDQGGNQKSAKTLIF